MTKNERLEGVVKMYLALRPFDEDGVSSDFSVYVGLKEVLDNDIAGFLSSNSCNTEIKDGEKSSIGDFVNGITFSASDFGRVYFPETTLGDDELRRKIEEHLTFKNKVFRHDGSIVGGFSRKSGVYHLTVDGIVFVEWRLFRWYIEQTFLNPYDFAKYAETEHIANKILSTLYPSIEKDRQNEYPHAISDENLNRTRKSEAVRTAISSTVKGGKKTSDLTNTLYQFLKRWFDDNYNSNICLVPETKRLTVASKLVARFSPGTLSDDKVFSRFNGRFFNPNDGTYSLKNGVDHLELAQDKTAIFYVGPAFSKTPWYGGSTITDKNTLVYGSDSLLRMNDPAKCQKSDSYWYESFGVDSETGGIDTNDTVGMYGFVTVVDPMSVPNQKNCTCREYFMRTGDEESIKKFCVIAMEGIDGQWKAYDKFCDYVDYCYRSNVDKLVEYADGVYNALVAAKFIKEP